MALLKIHAIGVEDSIRCLAPFGHVILLSQAPDAHRYIQSRQSTGKLIITRDGGS